MINSIISVHITLNKISVWITSKIRKHKYGVDIDDANAVYNRLIFEMDKTLNSNKEKTRIEQIDAVYNDHSLTHAWVRLYMDFYLSVKKWGMIEYATNNYHQDNIDVFKKLIFLTNEFIKINDTRFGIEFLSILKDLKIIIEDENHNPPIKLESRYNKISLKFFIEVSQLIKLNIQENN